MNMVSLIDALMAKNVAFACWFSPETSQPQLIIDSAPRTVERMSELNTAQGFVFAPFKSSARTPIILLQPEIYLKTAEDITAVEKAISSLSSQEMHMDGNRYTNQATDFASYKEYVGKAIAQLQNADGELSKIVLSKIIEQPKGDESLGELFFALKKANPRVFIYIIKLPDGSVWLGATPEVLLSSNGDSMQTMSLAGTQALRDDKDYRWRAKEIEEQAFVSRYTLDTLNRYHITSYHTIGPEDYETSVVAHLKTTFLFSAKPIKHCLGEFVADLAPTPAVCGLPKQQAKQWISENEPHARDYYTGFLGEWRLHDDALNLFVNIRCLRALDTHYQLFTGGGITAKSDIQAEWNETDRKAQTLLQVLEKH